MVKDVLVCIILAQVNSYCHHPLCAKLRVRLIFEQLRVAQTTFLWHSGLLETGDACRVLSLVRSLFQLGAEVMGPLVKEASVNGMGEMGREQETG